MRHRFFIVLNPSAGVPRQRFFAEVLARLNARGAVSTVIEPREQSEAAAAVRAACASHDVIVAAGGDGTIRQAAAAAGCSQIPLGLIPLGTGNVVAREIGLQRTAKAVADTLIDGPIRTVHGARANGEPFYLMAGAGFDGRVVGCLNQSLKRTLGRAAFGPAMMSAWRQPIDRLQVTIDGQHHTANWMIVANARHYGGSFVLAPDASIFEAGLKVILIRAETRRDLAWQIMRIARGSFGHADCPAVRVLDAHRVIVTCADPSSPLQIPVQVDGDKFGTLPLDIDANGPQLRLIVPR